MLLDRFMTGPYKGMGEHLGKSLQLLKVVEDLKRSGLAASVSTVVSIRDEEDSISVVYKGAAVVRISRPLTASKIKKALEERVDAQLQLLREVYESVLAQRLLSTLSDGVEFIRWGRAGGAIKITPRQGCPESAADADATTVKISFQANDARLFLDAGMGMLTGRDHVELASALCDQLNGKYAPSQQKGR